MEAKSGELVHTAPSAERRMRVLLDGRKLNEGGIGVYTENIIVGLLEVGGVEISVLYRDERCRQAPYANDVTWIREDARSYSLDELLFLSSRIDFSRFDLFHTPHYMVPYRIPIPTVVTIHDLIHITHPERLYYPWVAKALIRSAVRRADSVLTVSRHTRAGVLALTRAPEAKVTYLPNAISERLKTSSTVTPLHGDSHPYLVAIFSNVKPHKALSDLLGAYKSFREGRRWEGISPRCPKLLLAGYGIETFLNTSAGNTLLEGVEGVRLAGSLSDAELRAALQGSLALVVPSLAEGFCLPAIEAQSLGTPVVCRPVPALREIVTERDVIAESFSVESLTVALERGVLAGLSSPREVPRAHLELYSCRAIASRLKSEYQRVLAAREGV